MRNDLLLNWIEKVSIKKFKLGEPLNQPYADTIKTEKVLRSFFNESDYVVGQKKFDDENYLVYLLSNISDANIYLLNEIASLIEYHKKYAIDIILKSKKGYVPHYALSNMLFEVWIDKFLNEQGIITLRNTSYIDSNNNKKPLDNYFEYEGNKYLIECVRIDEPINKSMLQIGEYLMHSIYLDKQYDYKSFRGYVGFKTDKNLSGIIDKAKGSIWQVYKEYMKCFDTKSSTITIPKKYSTPDFDIEIMPFYMGKSFEELQEQREYDTLVAFTTEVDPNNIKMLSLSISGYNTHKPKRINDKLFEKVKKKIDQHKDAPKNLNRIILVEIDVTKGHSPNTPMFSPIGKNEINLSLFKQLTDELVSVAFIFKDATDTGIRRQMKFLSSPTHQSIGDFLIDRLE